jgi:hypothetical protein
MKRAFAPLLVLVVAAAFAVAQDNKAQAPAVVSVSVTTNYKKTPRPKQVPQYGLCDTLAHWGLKVQSKVATQWDSFLKKAGVVVVEKPKDDKKDAPKLDPATLSIEGTIEISEHEVKFYDNKVDVICRTAKVDVVVKDAQGKELKKISWENLRGMNSDAGDEKVVADSEKYAVRFLCRDVLETKEVADLVPKDKQEDLAKFLKDEDAFYNDNFDDTNKHREKKDADEKK